MADSSRKPIFFLCVVLAVLTPACVDTRHTGQQTRAAEQVFVGSTPGGSEIQRMLGIPSRDKPELLEWRLRLTAGTKEGAEEGPSTGLYELSVDYGVTRAGFPGIGRARTRVDRQGSWIKTTGSVTDWPVYELRGMLQLAVIDDSVLQIVDGDGSLMAGNGGWSYTLNRTDLAEPRVDPMLSANQPSLSYRISAKASGPGVFAIFEGRTPNRGIAAQIGIPGTPGSSKAKWRVSLFRDPDTQMPTTYKVEGSLYSQGARAGTWTIEDSGGKKIYRLASQDAERDILLLRGGDRVLFFMTPGGVRPRIMVGNAEFSYTLNAAGN